jgi:hypothetical protein
VFSRSAHLFYSIPRIPERSVRSTYNYFTVAFREIIAFHNQKDIREKSIAAAKQKQSALFACNNC